MQDDLIGLAFAFEIRATIGAALDGGPGRLGHRRIIPITGGTVTGPRLTGRVIPGGADYELIRPDGNSEVEAHYTIEATDGTPIYICNKGLFVAPAQVIERLDAGDPVAPSDYYFRSAPVFDAREGPHAWLSDRLFAATCRFTATEVTIRVFEVT
ncbi:DUF3237 domain-containing protein [Rhodalgimonas zhirmunskyi]|uniref:UPF0311 protein NOI20_07985 n=1 Tax=Rhodalgimonas zhirmunskyi TaxID=2964767 RepID=A0AAJ1U5L1_9RHOB|nr:DUF3237 domain-containing protein [Rhodoalgimonas zhirmunskyi]MDQ2094045.1 DUF3237 domain-containing protein [Rhodoalgimonas zhirmunskyi]